MLVQLNADYLRDMGAKDVPRNSPHLVYLMIAGQAIGVPPSITLSEFSGWAPWLRYVLTIDLYKLAVAAAIVALAWLAWPRGTALTAPLRWRTGMRRCAGGAGALAAAAVAVAIGTHRQLHDQLVTLGGYESAAEAEADDAAWEARWWTAASPFSMTGGTANVVIDPAERLATARWRLDGVRSHSGTLHGSVPDGAQVRRATVNGREAVVTIAFDHFALPLDACGSANSAAAAEEPARHAREASAPDLGTPGPVAGDCTVELEIVARGEGWSAEGETPWLHPSGVWLRAADLLPTLGHDPDRLVRAPRERAAHGLAPVSGDVAAGALDAPAVGVAAAGDAPWVREYTPLATVGWAESAGRATAGKRRSQAGARLREAAPPKAGRPRGQACLRFHRAWSRLPHARTRGAVKLRLFFLRD